MQKLTHLFHCNDIYSTNLHLLENTYERLYYAEPFNEAGDGLKQSHHRTVHADYFCQSVKECFSGGAVPQNHVWQVFIYLIRHPRL